MKNWDTIEDNVHLTKYWELYYIYPRESPTEPAAIRWGVTLEKYSECQPLSGKFHQSFFLGFILV